MTDLPPISAVEVLRLDPGDIIAVHVEQQITAEEADNLKRHVESVIHGHRVIVLAGGIRLTVVEPDEA